MLIFSVSFYEYQTIEEVSMFLKFQYLSHYVDE